MNNVIILLTITYLVDSTVVLQSNLNQFVTISNPLVQDISSYYSCPSGQIYNPKTCSCECRKSCCTTGNQIFRGLPYCDCISKCPKKAKCDIKHYWDENSCSCKCIPKSCPKGYIQDETSCSCISCVPINCGIYYIWDPVTCKCVPPISCVPINCGIYYIWDPVACKCVPPPPRNNNAI